MRFGILSVFAVVVGCGSGSLGSDAGSPDAAPADASAMDGASTDAAPFDGGSDLGVHDGDVDMATTEPDLGTPDAAFDMETPAADLGTPDAGGDAGSTDAGSPRDAGVDAGPGVCRIVHGGVYLDSYAPGGDNRDRTGAPRVFHQSSVVYGGRSFVFSAVGSLLNVYDPYDAGWPRLGFNASLWSGPPVYLHNEYPLQHFALAADSPYGIASFTSEGWVLFRVDRSPAGLPIGVTPLEHFAFESGSGSPDTWIWRSQLYRVGVRYHAVGRYLGPSGSRSADLAIVDLGDGTTPPPLTRLGIVRPETGSQYFHVFQAGSSWYLYLFGRSLGQPAGALFIYDITTPASPALVATVSGATEPGVAFDIGGGGVTGERAVITEAGGRRRLYTAPVSGSGTRRVYAFDLTDPRSPRRIAMTEVADAGFIDAIDGDGRLLVVGLGRQDRRPMARYFDVQADTFRALGDGTTWNAAEGWYDFALATDVALARGGSGYRVLLGAKIRGYWDELRPGCL